MTTKTLLTFNPDLSDAEVEQALRAKFTGILTLDRCDDVSPVNLIGQALSQISPFAFLELAHIVFTAPKSEWIEEQSCEEIKGLADFLACYLAEMGQN